MKITVNGIEMNYELTGKGNSLVLIHGFSDNLNMWYNQVPAFSKEYRVLAYDVRGFGQTEMKKTPYSPKLFSDDLYELLKSLEIGSACILGYSMGGGIGLEFALEHPEMTTGLVFANSGIGEKPSDEMVERRKMAEAVFQQGDIAVIAELMAAASFSPGFDTRNPEAFKRYKDIKMQNNPSEYYDIMQAITAVIDEPADLSQLQCPALIIAGDQDSFMDVRLAESMRKSIRNAEVVILPTGHAAAIEMPEEFNRAVLDFMKKLEWPG